MTNSPEQNTDTDTDTDTFIPVTITQTKLSALIQGDTITATSQHNDNTVISITPPDTNQNTTKSTPQRLLEATTAIIVLLFGIAYATATNFTGYSAYLGLITSLLGALWILTEIRTLSLQLD